MSSLLILIPALPLVAAILTAILGPRLLKERSHWPAVIAIGLSFVCSVALALQVRHRSENQAAGDGIGYEFVTSPLWTWAAIADGADDGTSLIPTAGNSGPRNLVIDVSLRADALTSIMLVMVTFVATLVAIYAGGYMHGDTGYWRFFAYVALFVFSMTMLVSVSNFLLLYVFWEAVGVCSYLLIGFWYEKPEAVAAGKKAFLVNRVGDFGFALALFFIWTCYGTFNFHDVNGIAGVFGQSRLADTAGFVTGWPALAICLLLLVGACGKSAQFPLHVWLPDAMEGPTPVSALIHAATMVTAGVYMVARCTPLFMASPDGQMVVACVGGITALMAGIIAMTQNDLKRILAYSTISQLGYMFLALGVGSLAGIAAGMFHLFTHAFFKALLFLGAGSVMHAMGGVIDIRRFSGLRRIMPITCATFAIGSLALAGIFPFAGFWSKDAIIGAVHDQVHEIEQTMAFRGPAESSAQRFPSTLDAGKRSWPVATGAAEGLSFRAFTRGDWGNTPQQSACWSQNPLPIGGPDSSLLGGIPPNPPGAVPNPPGAVPNPPRTFAVSDMKHVVALGDAGTYRGEDAGHTVSSHISNLTDAQLARGRTIYTLLYYISFFTAFLTALYTFRAFFLTFYGDEEIPHEAGHHAHESPSNMWVPLAILAACAAGIGFFAEWSGGFTATSVHPFSDALAATPSLAYAAVQETPRPGTFHLNVAVTSSVVALLGVALAAFLYLGPRTEAVWLARMFDAIPLLSPYKISQNKFYWDEIYNVLIVQPFRGLAAASYAVDRWLVDGIVNLVGWIPRAVGALMRGLQIGLVPFYGLAMVLGVLTFLAARMLWGNG